MAKVLTAQAVVQCAHPAPGTVAVSTAKEKLTVKGQSVLLAADVTSATIVCPPSNTSNSGMKPCTKIAGVTATLATKLTVANTPVLLDPLSGTTDGSAPGPVLLTATESQLTLTAI
jgi:hypothetical protein